MKTVTLTTLAWELHEQGTARSRIAKQIGKHRGTVWLWLSEIEQFGLLAFLDSYRAAKRIFPPKRQTPLTIKPLVRRVAYFLVKEHDIKLCGAAISAILAERYILRSKDKQRNVKRGAILEPSQAHQKMPMDTVHFGAVYAFTAVDIYSREADVHLTSTLTANSGALFPAHCMPKRYAVFAELIQTDGAPEFKAGFMECTLAWCDKYRTASSYK